jgi:hypothetical protein
MIKKLFGIKQPEEKFWDWFKKNSNTIYHFEENHEQVFDMINNEIAKVNHDLTFEFGPIQEDGKRIFVVSADGIKSVFPAVFQLVNSVIELDQWRVVAFRQRMDAIELQCGVIKLTFDDVYVKIYEDEDRLGLVLFVKECNEVDDNLKQAIYILLDSALGEYDVETKIGCIEVLPFSELKNDANVNTLSRLAEIVDEYFLEG